jgi:hypothetical protein
MPKYETNNIKWSREADGDEFWCGATGGDVLKSYVTRPNDYTRWGEPLGKPTIELQIERLIEAVGEIADKTGINLLEVFHDSDLQVQYRLNQDA